MIKNSFFISLCFGILFFFQACNSKGVHSIETTNQEAKAWCQNLSDEEFSHLAHMSRTPIARREAVKNESPNAAEANALFYNPFFWDWFFIMYDICATNAEGLGYGEDDPEFYSIVKGCMTGT